MQHLPHFLDSSIGSIRRALLGTLLAAGVFVSGGADARAQATLVSVRPGESIGIGGTHPRISADGTRVVFVSNGMHHPGGPPDPPGAPVGTTFLIKDLESGALTVVPFPQPVTGSSYAIDAQATLITNGPAGSGLTAVLYRYDTGTGLVQALATNAVEPAMSADGSVVVWRTPWRSNAGLPQVIAPGPGTPGTQPLSHRIWCPRNRCDSRAFGLSADGRVVSYFTEEHGVPTLAIYDIQRSSTPTLSLRLEGRPIGGPSLSGDGRFAVFAEYEGPPNDDVVPVSDTYVKLFDRTTGRVVPIGFDEHGQRATRRQGEAVITPNGRFVAFTVFGAPGEANRVYARDLATGISVQVNAGMPVPPGFDGQPSIDPTGRYVAFHAGHGNGDVYLYDLDQDGDGMWDAWEARFGLDPSNQADGMLDSDGDGVLNVDEFTAASHPTALSKATQLFAEGAHSAFFTTRVSLFNPAPEPAAVTVRLLSGAGEASGISLGLAPGGRAEIDPSTLPHLVAGEFAIAVESNQPIVADRRMTWDTVTGYGSHASTGTPAPSTTWYFAEGATIAGFQAFYLLQNPGEDPAQVTFQYLLQDGAREVRHHVVPARSRFTVWVNHEGAPLDAAEFAAVVTASTPIVAERAIYRDGPGQPFAAGSNAMGVTALSTRWTFAEGATGDFFDTFILVGNPGDSDANVRAEFQAASHTGGLPAPVVRSYRVPAGRRLTIWVDHVDPALADTAVSTTITSDVGVVAERAMWWPGSPDTWEESHAEFGATDTGFRFAIADGELDDATSTDTFLLVNAAVGGEPATARVKVLPMKGGAITRDVPLTEGRNTIWIRSLFPELNGQRFAVTVQSLDRPAGRAPITVEKAIYSRAFSAGAASLATRVAPTDEPATAGLEMRFEHVDHPRLRELAQREGLHELVAGLASPFARILAVKDWAAGQWPAGNPDPYPPWDAVTILDWIRAGTTGGFCAQYSQLFLQSLAALGFTARYVEIGSVDNPYVHFVTEVWVPDFGKWVLLDADFNLHFEHEGVPLSALDIHDALLDGRASALTLVRGTVREGHSNPDGWPLRTAELYHYVRFHLKANHLSAPSEPPFDRYGDMVEWLDDRVVPWHESTVESPFLKEQLTSRATSDRQVAERSPDTNW